MLDARGLQDLATEAGGAYTWSFAWLSTIVSGLSVGCGVPDMPKSANGQSQAEFALAPEANHADQTCTVHTYIHT
jgi:hypothetical protein